MAVGLYVRSLARRREPLGNPFGRRTEYFSWRGERIAYTVAGEGDPVLLVHGVYAGASSFEFRRNFDELSRSFRVYAPDLPGYGLSDRPSHPYAAAEVTDFLEAFARECIGEQAHVVASSLGATLLVPAAVRSPRLFKRLILICPAGIQSLTQEPNGAGDRLYRVLRGPVGDVVYQALVTRSVLGYYLGNMVYHDPTAVTPELVDHYYRTSHQPGAKYAPVAFICGLLNRDIREEYPRVPHQTLIVWGNESKTTPVEQAEAFFSGNPRANLRIFRDAAQLPHDERSEKFNEISRRFLRSGSPGHVG